MALASGSGVSRFLSCAEKPEVALATCSLSPPKLALATAPLAARSGVSHSLAAATVSPFFPATGLGQRLWPMALANGHGHGHFGANFMSEVKPS